MKSQLNVSFYSAVGLIEKIYLDIFPDLSKKIVREIYVLKLGLRGLC